MTKTKKAILFPGQGSQYRGMGKTLFRKYAYQTNIASEILGYDIEELCLEDPNRQLNQTEYTQTALYVVNNFLYQEQELQPDFLIGHSLGEYNALLAAGAFDFETGLRLVQKRGALMGAASGGRMAAVIGLNRTELTNLLQNEGYANIDIANINTPSQLVLSGKQVDIDRVVQDFSSKKITIIPLRVSAPFHSRYMVPAAKQFSTFLENFTFEPLRIPVISNVTAHPYENHQIADLLAKQINHSVQWVDSIRFLMGQDVQQYKELGRNILTKMANEIREKCTPIIYEATQTSVVMESNYDQKISEPSTNEWMASNDKSVGMASVASATLPEKNLAFKLGNTAFKKDYGIKLSYLSGSMYRGIASKELVVAMGKAGMMGYLGTGGMSLTEIEENITYIQRHLANEEAYGMNLLHHFTAPESELKIIELYLKKGIKNIEASAFMQMTESLVYFHTSGLEENSDGTILQKHKILAKISRPEVAAAFMKPAPERILNRLIEAGKITDKQAELAKNIPISYDICVEADSGGHTDSGVAMVLLPSIQRLRETIQKEYVYQKEIRVGLAGGIGTPQSVACAFVMGADFVLTGSINQCTVEAGMSDAVKDLLVDIDVQDTTYAPAGDMFEIGAKVQVLRKGVLFPARANKLYNLYNQYNSIEAIPQRTIDQLEKNYFKKSIPDIWAETKNYLINKGLATEIDRAERMPKHKMALIFRWYFSYSGGLTFKGDLADKVNFQVHTGPALGAFNQWVKGTGLEDWRNRHVDQIGIKLMEAAAELLKYTLKDILS